MWGTGPCRSKFSQVTPCTTGMTSQLVRVIPVAMYLATRNRVRDHLIAAFIYSQMLCQLSYRQDACLTARRWLWRGQAVWGTGPGRSKSSQVTPCTTSMTSQLVRVIPVAMYLATRNRARDHLIAAFIYCQMLCQLSYRQDACLTGRRWLWQDRQCGGQAHAGANSAKSHHAQQA